MNFSDSIGTSCHYGGDPKYHPGCHVSPYDGFCNSCEVKDCCWPQDRVIPEKPKPSYIQKVVETIGAAICTPEISAGAGTGFGAKVEVTDYISASALIHADMMRFTLSRDGLAMGPYGETDVSAKFIWDHTIIHEEQYDPAFGKSYSTSKGNVPNKFTVLEFGSYCFLGGSVRISVDLDYFSKRYNEIWG